MDLNGNSLPALMKHEKRGGGVGCYCMFLKWRAIEGKSRFLSKVLNVLVG